MNPADAAQTDAADINSYNELHRPRVDDKYKQRMETAYTQDYLRIVGIEHYRLAYFTPDLAPDDLPAALERYLEVLLDPLEIKPDHVVLDVGCGIGATTAWMVRRYGCRVYAIDIVADFVDAAARRFAGDGMAERATAQKMDALDLAFPAATFDFIVGLEVIYHFPDKQRFFTEAARVLKPGGTLVLSEYLTVPGAPRLGTQFVQMILESDKLETEATYRSYLAAANLSAPRLTDVFEQTVVGTNRAFRSSRYRSRVKAYSAVYFGLLFAAAMPAVYWLWEQLFKRGHARHVFMYSQKAATPAPPPGLSSGAAG